MSVVAIIQARMGSTRLPGKVLKPLAGRPALWHVVERVRCAESIDGVIVATSTSPGDDAVAAFAVDHGFECFRGSEDDVLDRYYQAAQRYPADHYVRITADCPILSPALTARTVEVHLANDNELTYVDVERGYPRGYDVDVFTGSILVWLHENCTEPDDREHVDLYLYNHIEDFKAEAIRPPDGVDMSRYRLTLDTAQDYELLSAIFDQLYVEGEMPFELGDVIALLEAEPELAATNRDAEQKGTDIETE
ncbi:MAG: NTP transferase domain-containing protein [bacterium]|nr:NTP transferase domain-containing protein [bacterium]